MTTKTNKKSEFKSIHQILEGQLDIYAYLAKKRIRCDTCGGYVSKVVETPQLDNEQYQERWVCEMCLTQAEKVGIEI